MLHEIDLLSREVFDVENDDLRGKRILVLESIHNYRLQREVDLPELYRVFGHGPPGVNKFCDEHACVLLT